MNNEYECRYLFEPIKEHEIISLLQDNINKSIDIQFNNQFECLDKMHDFRIKS